MLSKFAVITALLVGSTFAAPALQNSNKLRRVKSGKVEPNSYIVVLKKDASRAASLQSLNELVVAFDEVKEVTNSDWTVLNGYSATLTGAALQHVLNDPSVDYVEENAIINLTWNGESDVLSREAASISEDIVKRQNGAGVDIYSIDTGVRVTHSSFGGRARWGAVFAGTQQDGNGHGTHTAGTAAGSGFGSATGANIIAVKVLGDDGSGTNAGVISGVNFVRTSAASSGRPSVANMSLGGGAATALDSAVSNAIASGVHFVIAAGNSNVNAANTSPARVTTAITVAAISSTRAKASFSNFGAIIDCWYLGVSVTSAWSTSDTATNTISGTSMAAPGVAGLVANYISRVGNQSPAAVEAALKAARVCDVTGVPSGTTNCRCVPF